MDLNSRAVELVLDCGLTPMLGEDLIEVFRHLGKHRFHRREQPQAARPETGRSLEERDLRDEAEVSEEHVGRPNGLRIDAGGVRDSLEHDPFVHADPHLPEDVPQKDVALLFGRTTEEGFQEPATRPGRIRPADLGDLRKQVGGLQDRQRPRDQGGLLRPREGLLQGRPSHVQSARIRLREDATDDQVDRGGNLVSSEGFQKGRQEGTLLEALRCGLELRGQLGEARERSLVRNRRRHGESGPSDASGFKVSPKASVFDGPRNM